MTDDDPRIQQTADLLKQFEPGFLPYPVFEQIARLIALPILEFIPLRERDGRIEVLLIERAADDPFWPGMFHTPGTVIRATDAETDSENWPAFQRILHDELKDTKVSEPYYVGSLLHKSKRGVEQAQLYWVEVRGDPAVGTFYDVESLPEGLIDSQLAFIRAAAESFRGFVATATHP